MFLQKETPIWFQNYQIYTETFRKFVKSVKMFMNIILLGLVMKYFFWVK